MDEKSTQKNLGGYNALGMGSMAGSYCQKSYQRSDSSTPYQTKLERQYEIKKAAIKRINSQIDKLIWGQGKAAIGRTLWLSKAVRNLHFATPLLHWNATEGCFKGLPPFRTPEKTSVGLPDTWTVQIVPLTR